MGLFLGIQFLFWTISGLYFSWTDLDEIHGDHFKKIKIKKDFKDLISPSDLDYVKRYYGYSNEKAKQALKLLSKEQLNFIKSKFETGGSK